MADLALASPPYAETIVYNVTLAPETAGATRTGVALELLVNPALFAFWKKRELYPMRNPTWAGEDASIGRGTFAGLALSN